MITNLQETFDIDIYVNDKDRIRRTSEKCKDMTIAEAFDVMYGIKPTKEHKNCNDITNIVTVIEVGQTYYGVVKEFKKDTLVFDIPGVKEELICKENFNDCLDVMQNYLITHSNILAFTVREKQKDKFIVSVLEAYYNLWKADINKAIQTNTPIDVHIDSLIKAGYNGHTPITTINEVTGKCYTASVFIPGSHIVLNIEHDFPKWVDTDVKIIPQKFVKFKPIGRPAEDSLVGSRKKLLENVGMQNMLDIWTNHQLSSKPGVKFTSEVFLGTVTGIINSNKKTGVFIELEEKCITGLMPLPASELLKYKPGDQVYVKVKEFETQEGADPFILKRNGRVRQCNTRVVFEPSL